MINTPQHTPEPWRFNKYGSIFTAYGVPRVEELIARCLGAEHQPKEDKEDIANAQRIVQCVNACAGIVNPEALPDVIEAIKDFLSKRQVLINTDTEDPALREVSALVGRADSRLTEALAKLEGQA